MLVINFSKENLLCFEFIKPIEKILKQEKSSLKQFTIPN